MKSKLGTKLNSATALCLLLGVASPIAASAEEAKPSPAVKVERFAVEGVEMDDLEKQVENLLLTLDVDEGEKAGKAPANGAETAKTDKPKRHMMLLVGPEGKLRKVDAEEVAPAIASIIEGAVHESSAKTGEAEGVHKLNLDGKLAVISPDGSKEQLSLNELHGVRGAMAHLLKDDGRSVKMFAVGPGVVVESEDSADSPEAHAAAGGSSGGKASQSRRLDKVEGDLREIRGLLEAIERKLK